MSDHRTEETNGSRSFEERVFARFDAMDRRFDGVDARFDRVDARLDSLENRVEKLESRQYDTKPIWEQALAAIAETNQRLDETNSRLDQTNSRLDQTNSRLDETNKRLDETNEKMDRGFELLRNEIKTEFTAVRHEMEHSLRWVDRKIDVLNQNIFNFQVDHRYIDRRLAELESQIKPT